MSVDLVLGVMQAADKSRTQRAQERLVTLEKNVPDIFGSVLSSLGKEKATPIQSGADADIIAGVMAAADPEQVKMAEARLIPSGQGLAASRETGSMAEAAKGLEASLLTTVVEQILPSGSHELYGSGTAGEVARHFQVENLARAAAEAEPLGLAGKLYGNESPGTSTALVSDSQWPYFSRNTITPYAS